MQRDNFLKAASVVRQRPWLLNEAAEYIERLVQNNDAGYAPEWQLPSMDWIFGKGGLRSVVPAPAPEVTEDDVRFANRGPAPVRVRMRTKQRSGVARANPPEEAGPSLLPDALKVPDPIVAFRGAPDALRALGAPSGSGIPPQSLVHRRPAAAETSERPRTKRPRLGSLPEQWVGKLGCAKCRRNPDGCRECREKAGLLENPDGSWGA